MPTSVKVGMVEVYKGLRLFRPQDLLALKITEGPSPSLTETTHKDFTVGDSKKINPLSLGN